MVGTFVCQLYITMQISVTLGHNPPWLLEFSQSLFDLRYLIYQEQLQRFTYMVDSEDIFLANRAQHVLASMWLYSNRNNVCHNIMFDIQNYDHKRLVLSSIKLIAEYLTSTLTDT